MRALFAFALALGALAAAPAAAQDERSSDIPDGVRDGPLDPAAQGCCESSRAPHGAFVLVLLVGLALARRRSRT